MPPALVTAATTSRQWEKAKIGNSIPKVSHSSFLMGPPSRVVLGGDGRPPVVGLAARVARHRAHQVQRTRHLVAGDARPTVLVELLQRRLLAWPGLDHGGDPLPPP